jgi:hypothetical protein
VQKRHSFALGESLSYQSPYCRSSRILSFAAPSFAAPGTGISTLTRTLPPADLQLHVQTCSCTPHSSYVRSTYHSPKGYLRISTPLETVSEV